MKHSQQRSYIAPCVASEQENNDYIGKYVYLYLQVWGTAIAVRKRCSD